jgi:acyl carrier protein
MTWVANELAVPATRVTPMTRLAEDLGVDGDDADDLIRRFSKEFAVDMSRFDFARFFGPESAFNPLSLFWPPWWRMRRRLKTLTIADLIHVAESKRW